MITAAQMRAAHAPLGIDQKVSVRHSGRSVLAVQRMDSSQGNVRGVVGSLMNVVEVRGVTGIELIVEGARSVGEGCGLWLKAPGGSGRGLPPKHESEGDA